MKNTTLKKITTLLITASLYHTVMAASTSFLITARVVAPSSISISQALTVPSSPASNQEQINIINPEDGQHFSITGNPNSNVALSLPDTNIAAHCVAGACHANDTLNLSGIAEGYSTHNIVTLNNLGKSAILNMGATQHIASNTPAGVYQGQLHLIMAYA